MLHKPRQHVAQKIHAALQPGEAEVDDRARERRRNKGFRMLRAGIRQTEVARLLRVSRATVYSWNKQLKHGTDPLVYSPRRGAPSRLSEADCRRLRRLLQRGPAGQATASRHLTLAGIAALIEQEFAVSYSRSQVSRIVRGIGWDLRKGCAMPADRTKFHAGWQRLARSKLAKLAGFLTDRRAGPAHHDSQA